nr:MAG TPA: hypothetical protein [Caudoviricetes sp.]
MADNTQLVQNIQSLAQTVGRDIKDIKTRVNSISSGGSSSNVDTSSLATKEELKVVESKIPKASGVPTLDFTVENNGDVYVDITYPEVGAGKPTIENGTTKIYDVVWGIAQPGASGYGRGYLEWSPISGFGKLHLDIKMTQNSGNGGVIATLPANAPVPSRLLEVAVDANNNSVYVEPNSRNIKGWGVAGNNKRYIFAITGFWKEIK